MKPRRYRLYIRGSLTEQMREKIANAHAWAILTARKAPDLVPENTDEGKRKVQELSSEEHHGWENLCPDRYSGKFEEVQNEKQKRG